MSSPTIFGREPAAVVGLIEAALVLGLSFGALSSVGIDSAEDIAVVMAVVSAVLGVYVAYVTKDTLLGAVITLIKAGAVLFAAYGFDLKPEQLGALIALVTVFASLYQRTQTSPVPPSQQSLSLAA